MLQFVLYKWYRYIILYYIYHSIYFEMLFILLLKPLFDSRVCVFGNLEQSSFSDCFIIMNLPFHPQLPHAIRCWRLQCHCLCLRPNRLRKGLGETLASGMTSLYYETCNFGLFCFINFPILLPRPSPWLESLAMTVSLPVPSRLSSPPWKTSQNGPRSRSPATWLVLVSCLGIRWLKWFLNLHPVCPSNWLGWNLPGSSQGSLKRRVSQPS